MTAYIYITISLLIYPFLGWLLNKLTKNFTDLRKYIIWCLGVVTIIVLICALTNTISTSHNLNWFLVTFLYFTFCAMFWLTSFRHKNSLKGILIIINCIGALIVTLGFPFTILATSYFDTDKVKWLTDDLIYEEMNSGGGFNAYPRWKKIEVYERIKWLPFLANRIKEKTYDSPSTDNLQNYLDVSYSKKDKILILLSTSDIQNEIWTDTIHLKPFY